MARIIRRLVFYGGIGLMVGSAIGYHIGLIKGELKKPKNASQLEEIAGQTVITNSEDNKMYSVDFNNQKLSPYPPQQITNLTYQQRDQNELKKLFE